MIIVKIALIQRNLLFAIMVLFFGSCARQANTPIAKPVLENVQSLEVPSNTIEKSKLDYNPKNSLWTLNGMRYSGYALSYFRDGELAQKLGILNGKKQNDCTDWYPDGHTKFLSTYHQGKLHGVKKSWSMDGAHHLLTHYNYHLGKAHGSQKQWYNTGELYKVLNLQNGREEGLQQAFRKNGVVYANYEARAGRIFGLKRAALCFELEDEVVKYGQ